VSRDGGAPARGGKLVVFGMGAAATDAQHIAVEFVHPVIVGKGARTGQDHGPVIAPRPRGVVEPRQTMIVTCTRLGHRFRADPQQRNDRRTAQAANPSPAFRGTRLTGICRTRMPS
jgi:hypothetical protein